MIHTPQLHGAIAGDGSADESDALQAAIYAVSDTDDTLHLNGGLWRINSQLLLPNKLHIIGPGTIWCSVFDPPVAGDDSCLRAYSSEPATQYSRLVMENVTFRYMQGRGSALRVERGLKSYLRNVFWQNWVGVNCIPLSLLGVQIGMFDNLDIDGAGSAGVFVSGLPGFTMSTDLRFNGCRIASVRHPGAALSAPSFNGGPGVEAIQWHGGSFEVLAGQAIDIEGARRCRFDQVRFEGLAQGAPVIRLRSSVADPQAVLNAFDECSFDSNGGADPIIELGADIKETRINDSLFPSIGIPVIGGIGTKARGNVNLADMG